MAGHANIKTTQVYDRRSDDISFSEIERVGILKHIFDAYTARSFMLLASVQDSWLIVNSGEYNLGGFTEWKFASFCLPKV